MFLSNKFIALYENALEFYFTLLSKFSSYIETVYNTYPYLLIVLICLIPILIFTSLEIGRLVTNFVFKRGSKKEDRTQTSKIVSKIITLYLTLEVYANSFQALESKFNLYESIVISVGTSFIYSLFIFYVLATLTSIAFAQFKILLDDKEIYKLKRFQVILLGTVFIMKLSYVFTNSFIIIVIALVLFYLQTISFLRGNQDEFSKPVINLLGSYSDKYLKYSIGILSPISLVIVILVGMVYKTVNSLTYFDFFKKISAKITRQQVEQVSTPPSDCEIPEDYKDLFESLDLKLYRPRWFNATIDHISDLITTWDENNVKEGFAHIVGDPGSGRRVLVDELCAKHKDLNPIIIEITKKIATEKDFMDFFEKQKNNFELEHKIVVFIGIENLFINKPKGFNALEKVFELVNRKDNGFFWINVCEQYPWRHIESFFGQVQHRNVFKVNRFSSEEIQILIESKNKKLAYKILYDKALYENKHTAGGDGYKHASEQYFTMIWEQSNGNPLMAQKLWLNSFRLMDEKNKKIKIGLPKRNDTSIFKNLIMDSFFIYNALVRHSRLTLDECCEVTRLNSQSVRFALAFGESEQFIQKDSEGNFYIERSWYAAMIQILKTKNLIYG